MWFRFICSALFLAPNIIAQLDVPFLSQVPPPDSGPPESISTKVAWHHTANCGQTSMLMLLAKYSQASLTEQAIRDADDFIYQHWSGDLNTLPATLNRYYGSYTGGSQVDRLIAIATSFNHGFGLYPDTHSYSATLSQLEAELTVGHPVIVGVWTHMCVRCVIHGIPTVPHWMVLTGITNIVYVNDPGEPAGKNNQYTLDQFMSAWIDQGSVGIFIHPPSTSALAVTATSDTSVPPGSGWSGSANYSVTCGSQPTFNNSVLPMFNTTVPVPSAETCTISFLGGGPPNSSVTGINYGYGKGAMSCGVLTRAPTCSASLSVGQTLTFVLQFASNPPTAGFTMSSGSQSSPNGQQLNLVVQTGSTATISVNGALPYSFESGGSVVEWDWTITGSAPETITGSGANFKRVWGPGTYTIALVVKDSSGIASQPVEGVVVVSGAPPVAPTGSLNVAREMHQATLLNSGLVLITGGYVVNGVTNTAEIYDPQGQTFRSTQRPEQGGQLLLMTAARAFHTATLLANGTVLIAGGTDANNEALSSAEVFDPITETFTAIGNMNHMRSLHRAVLLLDGRVLVIGGYDSSPNTITATTEIYSPGSPGSWQLMPTQLPQGGTVEFAATLLTDGRVLIAGCYLCSNMQQIEIFDPNSNSWQSINNMLYGRDAHTATALLTGNVLIAGGNDGRTPVINAELYDPTGGLGQSGVVGPVAIGGWRSTANLMPSGSVMLTGGYSYPNAPNYCVSAGVDSVQSYDPSSNTITTLPSMLSPRGGHTATLLSSGQVLVVGGFSQDSSGCGGATTILSTAEVITPL